MKNSDPGSPKTSDVEFFDGVSSRVADSSAWPAPNSRALVKLLFDGVLAYGLSSDESRVPPLMALYKHCLEHVDIEQRMAVYRELRDLQLSAKISINVYMPFLFVETHPSLVAEAVIDYCMTYLPDPADPLGACKDVCRWIDQDVTGNRGAAFGGLLCLGDDRVMELLATLKWTLTTEEIHVASRSGTGMPTMAGVEFWLSWTEELVTNGLGDSALMGAVATGLASVERDRRVGEYLSIRRNFGYLATGARIYDGAHSPSMDVLQRFTPTDIISRYAPRMYALKAKEGEPKVMSDVLTAFGLEPHAPVEQRSVSQ